MYCLQRPDRTKGGVCGKYGSCRSAITWDKLHWLTRWQLLALSPCNERHHARMPANGYSKFGTYMPEYAISIISPVITSHPAHITSVVTLPTSPYHLTSFTVCIYRCGNQISSRRQVLGSSHGTWPNTWRHETPGLPVRMTQYDARELRIAICDSQGSDFGNTARPQLRLPTSSDITNSELRPHSASTCTVRFADLAMETNGVLCQVGTGFYT